MQELDTIIVGQGLAGSCLAWELRAHGCDLLVIDRGEPVTASRIAAGLITPVTGQRFVKSWRFDEFLPVAREFYRSVEQATGEQLFVEAPMVRLFDNEAERALLARRQASSDYEGVFAEVTTWPEGMPAPHGGIAMLPAARLDVPRFLDVTRDWLKREQRYQVGEMHLPHDLIVDDNGVEIPRLGLRCRRLIFCQGFAAIDNLWCSEMKWNPAKGEILIVSIAGYAEERVVHRGLWIAPLGTVDDNGDRLYRVGATYDWSHLDAESTVAGRAEIETRLASILDRPFRVIAHQAAVRPILKTLNPVIGCFRSPACLGVFNGLGSKGSLQAPFFAKQFADHLFNGTPIESAVDLQARLERDA